MNVRKEEEPDAENDAWLYARCPGQGRPENQVSSVPGFIVTLNPPTPCDAVRGL